jgi:hemerythrin-like metal-binding protein
MVLDLIWFAGEVLSTFAFLGGAYLVLRETEPFVSLLGKNSAAPVPLSARDLRLIGRFGHHGPDGHSLSGNAVMDTQHQGLFDDANDLRATILSGGAVDEVGAILEAMIRDVVEHFRDEEAILAAADYSGTAQHVALHRELANNAATLAGRFRAGELGIGKLFWFLAHHVIAEHMLESDRELIPHLEGVG